MRHMAELYRRGRPPAEVMERFGRRKKGNKLRGGG